MREQYRRFMERRIRETLPFDETPVRLIWRERQQKRRTQGPTAPMVVEPEADALGDADDGDYDY